MYGEKKLKFFAKGVTARQKDRVYMGAFRLFQHLAAEDGIFEGCDEDVRYTLLNGKHKEQSETKLKWRDMFTEACSTALGHLKTKRIGQKEKGKAYNWTALQKERAPSSFWTNGMCMVSRRRRDLPLAWGAGVSSDQASAGGPTAGKRSSSERGGSSEGSDASPRAGKKTRLQARTLRMHSGNVEWRRPELDEEDLAWLDSHAQEVRGYRDTQWNKWEKRASNPWRYYGAEEADWPVGPRVAMRVVLASPLALECWGAVMRRGANPKAAGVVWWRSIFRPLLGGVLRAALHEVRAGPSLALEAAVAALLREWVVRGGLNLASRPLPRLTGRPPCPPSSDGSGSVGMAGAASTQAQYHQTEEERRARILELRREAARLEWLVASEASGSAGEAGDDGGGRARSAQLGATTGASSPYSSLAAEEYTAFAGLTLGQQAARTPTERAPAPHMSPLDPETLTQAANARLASATPPELGRGGAVGVLPLPVDMEDVLEALPFTPLTVEQERLIYSTSTSEPTPDADREWYGSHLRPDEETWATEAQVIEMGLMPLSPAVVRTRTAHELRESGLRLYEVGQWGRAWVLDPTRQESGRELASRGIFAVGQSSTSGSAASVAAAADPLPDFDELLGLCEGTDE
jgi:hypothetical protein